MIDRIKELEKKLESAADYREEVDTLNDLAWELKYKDLKRAIELSKKAEKLASKNSYEYGEAVVHKNLGTFAYLKSNFEKALPDLFRALEEFNRLGSKIDKAYTLNIIGVIYQTLGNNDKALEYFLRSLKLKEELKDEVGQATTLINIGGIYLALKKYKQSLDYSKKALEINRKLGNKQGEGMVLGNMGFAYQEMKKYSKALEINKKSLKIFEELGDKHFTAMSYGNIGVNLAAQNKLGEALENYQKSREILREIGDKSEECATMSDMGSVFSRMEKYTESIKMLKEALSISRELKLKPKISGTCLTLFKVYKETGDFKNALKYYEEYHSIEEEIFNEESEKRLNELMVEFQVERVQKEAEIYRLKNVELADKNKLITNQKKKLETTFKELQRTQKQLIESEKMASLGTLVAGVAHEINTPVGVGITASSGLLDETRNFSKLYSDEKISKSDLEDFLQTTYDNSDLILNNLQRTAKLIQSFKNVSVDQSTEQKRKFKLNSYLNDIVANVSPRLREKGIKVNIFCEGSLELESYPGTFAQVFTNLMLNSIVHGFADKDGGDINITAKKKGKGLIISYEDNGIGIDKESLPKIFDPFFTTNKQKGTGLGLHIVFNLISQKLNGTIKCIELGTL